MTDKANLFEAYSIIHFQIIPTFSFSCFYDPKNVHYLVMVHIMWYHRNEDWTFFSNSSRYLIVTENAPSNIHLVSGSLSLSSKSVTLGYYTI